MSESIVCCCATVGRHDGSLAPCGRVTLFTRAQRVVIDRRCIHADVIVVRTDEHVLRRARGSEPGMMAMTLRPGVFDWCHS
jgi:hypothetical protein